MVVIFMPFIKVIVFVTALFVLVGCTPDSDSWEAKQSLFRSVDMEPVSLGEEDSAPLKEIQQEIDQFDSLYDAALVQNGKQILVAYKVKHLQRFRMGKIEQELSEKLRSEYPDFEFLVSSDMKIFLEVVELGVHVNQEGYPEKQAQEWFQKIVDLKNDQA